MSTQLVAVFDDASAAREATDELIAQGLASRADISISPPHQHGEISTESTATASGGDTGGIKGFFASLFGTDDDRQTGSHYDEAVRRGSSALSVTIRDDSLADRAAQVLEDCGAIDVDERVAAWRTSGYTGHDPNAPGYTAEQADAERDKFKVMQEDLKVGKRTVDRGGVRVHRRVIETPVEQQVSLRDERAVVERHPVERPATQADFDAFKDQEIVIHETTEEPVVEKTARVVEEVSVGTQSNERTETIRDTVRHSDVDVERVGSEAGTSSARYGGPERRTNRSPFGGTERRVSIMSH